MTSFLVFLFLGSCHEPRSVYGASDGPHIWQNITSVSSDLIVKPLFFAHIFGRLNKTEKRCRQLGQCTQTVTCAQDQTSDPGTIKLYFLHKLPTQSIHNNEEKKKKISETTILLRFIAYKCSNLFLVKIKSIIIIIIIIRSQIKLAQ